jgi:hypothetical protein
MRYVIIRDDDTNALTPPDYLERLYRPFLERNLPVNLAVIPNVATNTRIPDGSLEGFLCKSNGNDSLSVPIGENPGLLKYLKQNPGYKILQHGYRHDYFEFDKLESKEVARRLNEGTELMRAAGFEKPRTFVAPYDKLSRASYREVASRFEVISTGWFELGRVPFEWWPGYVAKKIKSEPHWRVGKTWLLSHPGCLLSCHRNYDTMLETVMEQVNSNALTVLVTHWWEYFRNGVPDEKFIGILHQTAEFLASRKDIKAISFDDLSALGNELN